MSSKEVILNGTIKLNKVNKNSYKFTMRIPKTQFIIIVNKAMKSIE